MRALLMHDITPDDVVAEVLTAAGYDVVRCVEPGAPASPQRSSVGAIP